MRGGRRRRGLGTCKALVGLPVRGLFNNRGYIAPSDCGNNCGASRANVRFVAAENGSRTCMRCLSRAIAGRDTGHRSCQWVATAAGRNSNPPGSFIWQSGILLQKNIPLFSTATPRESYNLVMSTNKLWASLSGAAEIIDLSTDSILRRAVPWSEEPVEGRIPLTC